MGYVTWVDVGMGWISTQFFFSLPLFGIRAWSSAVDCWFSESDCTSVATESHTDSRICVDRAFSDGLSIQDSLREVGRYIKNIAPISMYRIGIGALDIVFST